MRTKHQATRPHGPRRLGRPVLVPPRMPAGCMCFAKSVVARRIIHSPRLSSAPPSTSALSRCMYSAGASLTRSNEEAGADRDSQYIIQTQHTITSGESSSLAPGTHKPGFFLTIKSPYIVCVSTRRAITVCHKTWWYRCPTFDRERGYHNCECTNVCECIAYASNESQMKTKQNAKSKMHTERANMLLYADKCNQNAWGKTSTHSGQRARHPHALSRPLYASVWVLYVRLCTRHALPSAVRQHANSNMRTVPPITHDSRDNVPKLRIKCIFRCISTYSTSKTAPGPKGKAR